MKGTIKGLATLALLTGVFGFATLKQKEVKTNAAYGNETIRVYLDKTVVIQGLGWWATDETWIHIWDGSNDHWQKMTKVNVNLFYFDVVGSMWNGFTDPSRGMEFYVYDTSKDQNMTYWMDGKYMKDNELNYIVINSANDPGKQSYDVKNYEVEQTISAIGNLDCDSTVSEVQSAVDLYNGLRAQGKTNLNTWTVAENDVTWFQRLQYFAEFKGLSITAARDTVVNNESNAIGLLAIGGLSVLTLGGYALLKKKQFI